MNVYVDTSAFLAIFNADDQYHQKAASIWFDLLDNRNILFTNSFVLVETHALLQNRLGLDAVKTFSKDILPILDIIWVDQNIYQTSMTSLLSSGRRNLSLVDCSSFVTMLTFNITTAFTFDSHFIEQGFTILN